MHKLTLDPSTRGKRMTPHNKVCLVGEVFNRLTVIAEAGRTPAMQTLWLCRCRCGGSIRTTTTKLRSGHTASCGCLKSEMTAARARKDGLYLDGSRHPLHDSYWAMIRRCHNDRAPDYPTYGARGISVCDRWRFGEQGKSGIALFIEDMGSRPSPRHTLDRRQNDGPYDPDNCRWATPRQQARNRRSNRLVECDGEQVALSEYCERKRLRFDIVNHRIGRGWDFSRAITQPLRGGGSIQC